MSSKMSLTCFHPMKQAESLLRKTDDVGHWIRARWENENQWCCVDLGAASRIAPTVGQDVLRLPHTTYTTYTYLYNFIMTSSWCFVTCHITLLPLLLRLMLHLIQHFLQEKGRISIGLCNVKGRRVDKFPSDFLDEQTPAPFDTSHHHQSHHKSSYPRVNIETTIENHHF
jgi:hypothetical protein